MFKTQNFNEISEKIAEIIAQKHNSDSNFYNFVDDVDKEITKIKEDVMKKSIKKTYGTGEAGASVECPDCGTSTQSKGLKKKNFS